MQYSATGLKEQTEQRMRAQLIEMIESNATADQIYLRLMQSFKILTR